MGLVEFLLWARTFSSHFFLFLFSQSLCISLLPSSVGIADVWILSPFPVLPGLHILFPLSLPFLFYVSFQPLWRFWSSSRFEESRVPWFSLFLSINFLPLDPLLLGPQIFGENASLGCVLCSVDVAILSQCGFLTIMECAALLVGHSNYLALEFSTRLSLLMRFSQIGVQLVHW